MTQKLTGQEKEAHPGQNMKRDHPGSHDIEAGADPRSWPHDEHAEPLHSRKGRFASSVQTDQKIGLLRQLANGDLHRFLRHLSATSQAYETLRVHAESQIAREKTKGNAIDLGNLDNVGKLDDQETRQEYFDPWQKNAGQGSEAPDGSDVEAEEEEAPTGTATTVSCLNKRGGIANVWTKLATPRRPNSRARRSTAIRKYGLGQVGAMERVPKGFRHARGAEKHLGKGSGKQHSVPPAQWISLRPGRPRSPPR